MAVRNPHPFKRAAREEARVWPAALLLVVLYLLVANIFDDNLDARTDAPPDLGAWYDEEIER